MSNQYFSQLSWLEHWLSFGGNRVGDTALSVLFLVLTELSLHRYLVMLAFLTTIADKFARWPCWLSFAMFLVILLWSAACREPIYVVSYHKDDCIHFVLLSLSKCERPYHIFCSLVDTGSRSVYETHPQLWTISWILPWTFTATIESWKLAASSSNKELG